MERFGTPEEVCARLATPFVANFMGSPPMNLMKDAPGYGTGAWLGVRPGHLDLGNTGWAVQIEAVDMLGADRLVYARRGAGSLVIRIHKDQGAPVVGATIHVQSRADRLHWFDAASGQRLPDAP